MNIWIKLSKFVIYMIPLILMSIMNMMTCEFTLSKENNDITLNYLNDIEILDEVINTNEISNNLKFMKQDLIKWNGPTFHKNDTVFYISLSRTLKGFVKNKKNGLWLWFINKNNIVKEEKGTEFFESNDEIENNEFIYGVKNNFKGLGIKINEFKLISIINTENIKVDLNYFNENSNTLNNRFKRIECDLPNMDTIDMRITFYNNYVYVEVSNSEDNYELCVINEYQFNDTSFLITGGLNEEDIVYKFNTLKVGQIKELNEYEDTQENSDKKIPQILETKVEIINNLSEESFLKTQNYKKLIDGLFDIESYKADLIQMEKAEFEIGLLNDVINQKLNFNKTELEFLSTDDDSNNFNLKLTQLIEVIKNITFEKISFLNQDPREELIQSLDMLKIRQDSMNISIVNMFETTINTIDYISSKAEKMETYQFFQQVLFVFIFFNALILFGMYKNLKEREEKAREYSINNQIKMSV